MRTYILFLLVLFLAAPLYGQMKDRRAVLENHSGIQLSVGSDEKLWLVSKTGEIFYCNHVDSTWHCHPNFKDTTDGFSIDNPLFERVSFFNKDTAIITGYISATQGSSDKNGYFLTTDGGITWQRRNYGGNSWIYTAYNDKKGNAWLGGLNKEIYRTSSYGLAWRTIKLPLDKSDRIYRIDMADAAHGIAATDRDELIVTEDDWAHIKYIETPHQQKRYTDTSNEGMQDTKIESIIDWGSYYMVRQHGHTFFTLKSAIQWQAFPVKLTCLTRDSFSKKLYAVNDSFFVVAFSDPSHVEKLTGAALESSPLSLQVVNGNVFIMDAANRIYRYSPQGRKVNLLYTTDHEIRDMDVTTKGRRLIWGTKSDGLYISEKHGEGWYREASTNFFIRDLKLLDDSTAILWDGVGSNYRYNLRNHTYAPYQPADPIKSFLSSPVINLSINAGSSGCFHNYNSNVTYSGRRGEPLRIKRNFDADGNAFAGFEHTVSIDGLDCLLSGINDHMSKVPCYQDFGISAEDQRRCLAIAYQNDTEIHYGFIGRPNAPEAYCREILPRLDTVSTATIKAMLDENEGMTSTTRYWFKVQIVNNDRDTLSVYRYFYDHVGPSFLPWQVSWKGFHYTCYDLALSRFFDACIPNNFMGKGQFDNSQMLYHLAGYLYRRKN